MTTLTREENVYMSKIAENAGRFDEMIEYMKKVVEATGNEELGAEERGMLAAAFKNAIGPRRSSWRILSSIELQEEMEGKNDRVALINEYKGKVAYELTEICEGILKLLDDHVIPSTPTGESKVLYLKLKGDYHRYMAEFMTGTERTNAADNALQAYESAQIIAKEILTPANATRLGLVLNISVFHYEIMNSHETACSLAQEVRVYLDLIPVWDKLPYIDTQGQMTGERMFF
eukprot:Gb_19084 [translate_table: standard]